MLRVKKEGGRKNGFVDKRRKAALVKTVQDALEMSGNEVMMAALIGSGLVIVGNAVYKQVSGKEIPSGIVKIAGKTLTDMLHGNDDSGENVSDPETSD
jgi:hypothetical protein